MTPRPIHRWKSLWLGVLVVCFLAWAWRDSMRFDSTAACREITASNFGGVISVASKTWPLGPAYPTWKRVRIDLATSFIPLRRGYVRLQLRAFVPPLLLRGGGQSESEGKGVTVPKDDAPASYDEALEEHLLFSPPHDWLVAIPHWLVMLVFVGAWGGFLGWRLKRQRNLTA